MLKLGFPGGSVVKNPPAKQKMQVWSLGQEDPLVKEMATHSSILAYGISWDHKELDMMTEQQAGIIPTKQSCGEVSP